MPNLEIGHIHLIPNPAHQFLSLNTGRLRDGLEPIDKPRSEIKGHSILKDYL